MGILGEISQIMLTVVLLGVIIVVIVLFCQILELGDIIEKYKEDKRHKKLIGKDYYRLIKEIRWEYEYMNNHQNLFKIVEEYLEKPEEYYVYLLKYEYTITLIKNMLDEAKENGVLYEEEFVAEVNSLIGEMKEEYEEIREKIEDNEDTLKKVNISAINKQLREEKNMLQDIRKLRTGTKGKKRGEE